MQFLKLQYAILKPACKALCIFQAHAELGQGGYFCADHLLHALKVFPMLFRKNMI